MNEKFLSGHGVGFILISFGIIISYLVAVGVVKKVAEQNTQLVLNNLDDSSSTICNRNWIGIS